jgi:hypothetical protein
MKQEIVLRSFEALDYEVAPRRKLEGAPELTLRPVVPAARGSSPNPVIRSASVAMLGALTRPPASARRPRPAAPAPEIGAAERDNAKKH